MPGTVKSGLLPDADRSHKCDCQDKVCWMRHLLLDKGHFITDGRIMSKKINVNGTVNPASGRGVINPKVLDVMLKDSGYLKQTFPQEFEPIEKLLEQYRINFDNGSQIGVTTVNDKVAYALGNGVLENPYWTINDIIQILGQGKKEPIIDLYNRLRGYNYTWELQSDLPLMFTVGVANSGNITLVNLRVNQPLN